jgi:small subunit ribosomal protein S18
MKNKNQDPDLLKISLINQGVFTKKKKTCPLRTIPLADINYKNISLLIKFISERGRMFSNRTTNLSPRKQREVAKAIKVARQLALLSPIHKETK